jgi:hypothetical protein
MSVHDRVENLLHQNHQKAKEEGTPRAEILADELQGEERTHNLSREDALTLLKAVLDHSQEWYILGDITSYEGELLGYQYTDAEGAARSHQHSGHDTEAYENPL